MLDDVPARAWLLILAAAAAYEPARYVFRHVAHSPARHDITQPSGDLSWRTTAALGRSLAVLAALVALSVFIFTEPAEQFARSAYFVPTLLIALGVFSLVSTARSLSRGTVQPLMRGLSDSYSRDGQPKRFWASLTSNGVVGVLCLGMAYMAFDDATAQDSWSKCADQSFRPEVPEEKFAACDEAVREYRDDPAAYLNRAFAYLDYEYPDEAIADFNHAHLLDPRDHWILAGRGFAYAWKGEHEPAEADFEKVRAVDPDNIILLRGEAQLSINLADLPAAEQRLTALLERHPDDGWGVFNRAEVYRRLGEHGKAQADMNRLRELIAERRKSKIPGQSP